ncbi:MAG: hypothetical protein U0931_35705 [Vulcanimicrobiota bacterium]
MIKRLLGFILLCGSAFSETGTGPGVYPPDGVILIQRSRQVTVRWDLPRGKYRAQLFCQGKRTALNYLQDPTWTVSVEPGQSYNWVLSVWEKRTHYRGGFSLAQDFRYSADGQNGNPGRPGPDGADGQPGRNGGDLKVELRRQPNGMHLIVRNQSQLSEYLFAEPGLRFTLSARGGDGGAGADGVNGYGLEMARGRDGGAAGWGGNLMITTYDCPWRDFLDIDVSPGRPGAPGKADPGYHVADGQPGKAGQAGRVQTHLGNPDGSFRGLPKSRDPVPGISWRALSLSAAQTCQPAREFAFVLTPNAAKAVTK